MLGQESWDTVTVPALEDHPGAVTLPALVLLQQLMEAENYRNSQVPGLKHRVLSLQWQN